MKAAKYTPRDFLWADTVDKLRQDKGLEVEKGVLQSTQAEEAGISSRCHVCFLVGRATGGTGSLSVVPGEGGEGKDMPVGATQVRNSELSSLVNTVSTCVYEGY